MRADRGKADDIAVRTRAAFDALAEFDEHTRRVAVGIADVEWWLTLRSLTLASG